MAQHLVGGDLGIGDLGDQFGAHPFGAAHRRAGGVDGRFVDGERVELFAQFVHAGDGEAGADLARIAKLPVLVDAEQQRAEAALLVRRRPADDDELLPLQALGLDPAARPRAAIGRVGELGDDAFQALPAHLGEQLLAAADDVLGEMEALVVGGDQRPQPLLARDVGERGQVLAVELEQVEGEERHVAARADRVLQRREVGAAVLERDDLAVDQRRRDRQRGRRLGDPSELVGPVEARAGIDLRLAAADRDQRAIAVVLDLVQPGAAGRDAVDQRAQLGLAKGGRGAFLSSAVIPAKAGIQTHNTCSGLTGLSVSGSPPPRG